MSVLVEKETGTDNLFTLDMSSGKKSAFVAFSGRSGMITVICMNASHRAYKGMGKTVRTWEEAKSLYKSAEMKAMIDYAETAAKEWQKRMAVAQ